MQKISDASGSKYSGGSAAPATSSGPAPPVASKPVFTPTQSSGGAGGFNPLSKRTPAPKPTNLDEDGWGEDAPQVTRTQLEKVTSAYQPTKVIMRDLSSKQEPSRDSAPSQAQREAGDVVKGAYQPVGKVDIAAIRRQAQSEGKDRSDRPAPVKGSYEPVGKVDIAAIRARAQPSAGPTATPPSVSPVATGDAPRSFGTATIGSERLTSLPKPKVANRFGAGTSTFTGTKPPAPGGFGIESKQSPKPPVGASRTFADEGGKTPAQLWAEKKAREGGASASSIGVGATPVAAQQSGNEGWKSGYTGKSWGSVQTTRTGQSAASVERQSTSQEEEPETAVPSGGVGAMRDMFKGAPPMGAAAPVTERSAPSPPPLATSTKPNAGGGVPIPGLPTRPAEQEEPAAPRLPSPPPQPRSPTPPTPVADSSSPIRLAMPVSSNQEPQIEDAREEQFSPPPAMPVRSMAREVAQHDEPDEPDTGDMARAAGTNVAANSFGQEAVDQAPGNTSGGKRALIQYDYEKAEDNELELVEGDYVTNIEMVDDDWWMGQNSRGESGLFPSNYVELVDDDDSGAAPAASHAQPDPVPVPAAAPPGGSSKGATATALYDYEAAEDNEITFPEDAKITNIVSASSANEYKATTYIYTGIPR